MSELRSFRSIEAKVHDELYNNLYLLTRIYETNSEFDRVFKKDMFVKNNKTAFYEVVYYLLDALNVELTREKLKSWRPYDIKRENQFRSELLQYINELNVHYKHANIPPMMASHLISPGGLKIAKFMLKLSQLVIFEHVQKKRGTILYCPIPNTNPTVTKAKSNILNRITYEVELRTKTELERFQESCSNQMSVANLLVKQLTDLDKNISEAKQVQIAAEEEFFNKYTAYPTISSLEEKIVSLNTLWNKLSNIHILFEDCKKIHNYLLSTDLVLHHSIQGISSDQKKSKLNLPEFFYTVSSLLNSKSLELPILDRNDIKQKSEQIKNIIEKYVELKDEFNTGIDQIKSLFNNLKCVDNYVNPLINNKPEILVDSLGLKLLEESKY